MIKKLQIIYEDGDPAFAVIPWNEYLRLAPVAADAELSDEALFDAAMAADEERFPAEVVDRLLAGENPVKVFREHRGMTQKDLAQKAGMKNPVYLSQIETGKRGGSTKLLASLARTLGVDLDDLVS